MRCLNCRRSSEFEVCDSCWNFAVSQLEKFPKRYDELEHELEPSKSYHYGERIQTSSSQPLPVKLETLALRSGAISKPLMEYEATIREIRRETKITFRGDEGNKIKVTCSYHYNRSEWIRAYFDDASKLALTIIKLANRLNGDCLARYFRRMYENNYLFTSRLRSMPTDESYV